MNVFANIAAFVRGREHMNAFLIRLLEHYVHLDAEMDRDAKNDSLVSNSTTDGDGWVAL